MSLTDFNGQVGWRIQLITSRLAVSGHGTEVIQIKPPEPSGRAQPNKEEHDSPRKYGSPKRRIVGTSGEQLTTSPTTEVTSSR